MNAAFWTLHAPLDRQGPGEAADVAWAVDLARPPRGARVLDAGAGPGGDIAALLQAIPEAHVTAVELNPDFVERIADDHDPARVAARQSDMKDVVGPFDFIWSAGAVYFLGVTEALTAWNRALAPGGRIAFSQICRFGPMPRRAAAFWAEAYPDLTDADGIAAQARAAGFRTMGTRRIGVAAWENYYGPLERRIAALRHGADAELAAVLDETEREIALWRETGDSWGYLLSVVERA